MVYGSRMFLVVFSFCFLCFSLTTRAAIRSVDNLVTNYVYVHPYDSLYLKGKVHVVLLTTINKSLYKIMIREHRYDFVSLVQKGKSLYIKARTKSGREKGSYVTIHLPVGRLYKLYLRGASSVAGRHIVASHLVINSDTSGMLSLFGHLQVGSIVKKGSGALTLQGITARKIYLRLSGGVSLLMGKVDFLYAEVGSKSRLYAQHLRVKNMIMSADSMAKATVNVINLARIFAWKKSRVVLNGMPHHLIKFEDTTAHVKVLSQ